MTVDSSPPARSGGSLVPLILLTLVAVAAGAAAMYFVMVYKPTATASEESHSKLMFMTGLSRPVKNVLDTARFTDADKDLIADAPVDAKQMLDPAKLTFCYVATEDPAEYAKAWKPFCDHLSKVTGKPVEYLELKSSEDQLKALRKGQLIVTAFNTGSVPAAVNICGFVPVARVPTSDATGTHVEIIVPSDSPIRGVEDFKDQKYTLVLTEPNSNTGYKAPMVLLHRQSIDPEREYRIRTTGEHRVSIEGIAAKQYDAAAVASDVLAREQAQGKIKKDQYRSIWKSESFPSATLGYAYNLKPDLAKKVVEAIKTFDTKGTPLETEFGGSNQTTLVTVNYFQDFALIRQIDDACGQSHELKDDEETPATKPAGSGG